jgi:hypothetical protein
MVRLVLAAFLVVALSAIYNGAVGGQDFPLHLALTEQLLRHPEKWFTRDITNRPLLYWIGGFCEKFSHGMYTFQLASIILTLSGTAALGLLHDATRRVISSPVIRVAGLALLAFLPLTVITTVVYAADTVASLPFVLAGWSVVRSLEQSSDRKAAAFAGLGCLAFAVGNFSKATFLGLPAAVVFTLLALWRAGRLPARRGWMVFGLGVVLPCLEGAWVSAECAREIAGEHAPHSVNWKGTGEVTLRTLVGVKRSDRRIFDAPEYFYTEMQDGGPIYPLLVANSYSYLALLHLGVFTDVMDLTNHALVPRPEPQRTAARWAVRLGLVFSLGAMVTVLGFWLRTLWALVRPACMPSAPALVWSSLAMVWYVPIAGMLPFVDHAYIMGYWLPRLVLPAVWIFLLSSLVAVDRLPDRWRRPAVILVAILVTVLCALNIRSIWY